MALKNRGFDQDEVDLLEAALSPEDQDLLDKALDQVRGDTQNLRRVFVSMALEIRLKRYPGLAVARDLLQQATEQCPPIQDGPAVKRRVVRRHALFLRDDDPKGLQLQLAFVHPRPVLLDAADLSKSPSEILEETFALLRAEE